LGIVDCWNEGVAESVDLVELVGYGGIYPLVIRRI
jgi:hypothetical protein